MDGIDSPNRPVLEAVAHRIRPLLPEAVFVGGQVTELYLTDPAATRIRPTTDVDVVAAAASRAHYRRIEGRLRELGFRNDTTEGAPICRWRSDDGHRLDLMPADASILGFSNRWYSRAVELSETYRLSEDLVIRILVAGRPELPDEFRDQAEEVRRWTVERIRGLLDRPDFTYALQGALPDAARMPGYGLEVRRRFETLAGISSPD